MFLDKYSKNIPTPTSSEGTAFAQDGESKRKSKKKKQSGSDDKSDDTKKDSKEVQCFKCKKKVHVATNCPDKDKDNDSSISSKVSIKALAKQVKDVQKSFAILGQQLQSHGEDEDGSEEEQSHFQFVQTIVLKQSAKLRDLDLRSIILLDSQSTVNVFCNRKYISNVRKDATPLKLSSNGGTMNITRVADIGQEQTVWYSPNAIANILSLKCVSQTYPSEVLK